MGRRQRGTEFIGMTDDEVLAIASSANEASERRQKAQRELKYRGVRNIQKRQG